MDDRPAASIRIDTVPGLSNHVAHVLRAPLSLILLELGQIEDPRARKLETRIEDYNRLLQSFLCFAGLTEALAREPGDFDLSQLVDEACDANLELAAARAVTVRRDIAPDVAAFGHRDAAFFCVLNIVENAVVHGNTTRQVAVRLDRFGRVVVTDDGEGIKVAPVERAFEPFVRGADVRQSAGLGLTIARMAIRAHGGACRIENAPTGGCAARIDFSASIVRS